MSERRDNDPRGPFHALSGTDLAALAIFVIAVVTRGALEAFARTPMDYGWITTFAAIAATWIGLGSRLRQSHDVIRQVEHNTNGELTAKLETVATVTADRIVSELQSAPTPTVVGGGQGEAPSDSGRIERGA